MMTCETHAKNAKLISSMQGAVPLSVFKRNKKTYELANIIGNNVELVKDAAKIAKEIFGNLDKNTSPEEIKQRTEYFKAVCQEYLNNGEDIHVAVRVNLEKGIINMDYGHYFGKMSPFDTMCRGLYLDLKNRTDDGVLLLPMNKFFNYGEPNAPSEEFIQENTDGVKFFEKIDGSMILARKTKNGELHIATRKTYLSSDIQTDGDDDAPYAKAAGRYLESLGTEWMDKDKTYSFEVVFPEDEMQRPVKHDNGLWVLSARDHKTGTNYTSDQLNTMELGNKDENIIRYPRGASFENMANAYAYAKELEGAEGFVGNFAMRNGGVMRLKFKSAWWFATHKAMSSIKTMKNLKKIANMLNTSAKKYVEKSTLYGQDIWDENKIDNITVRAFSDYLSQDENVKIDGVDDLVGMMKGQWKEARRYAQDFIDGTEGIQGSAAYNMAKKTLFTSNTPKEFKNYAGAMIDAYYGKSRFSIADMLKYSDSIVEKMNVSTESVEGNRNEL